MATLRLAASRRPGLLHLLFQVLILAIPTNVTSPVPAGMFQTRCLERHFWLSVKSNFLGSMIRFDFEDQHGFHFLSDQEATLCGYTVQISEAGDLVLRASFLACHVHTKMGTDYQLRVWFRNLQPEGTVAVYPLQLHCSIQEKWSIREIVCEENYMEVSIQKPLLPVTSKNDEDPEEPHMAVVFYRAHQLADKMKIFSLTEAAVLGYRISQHGSRLILRCPYLSPLSYFIREKGMDLEIVRAAVLYRLHFNMLAVDTTVACSRNQATAEGSDLVWTVPYNLSPLVHGQFRDRGLRFGVNGEALTESQNNERGYKIVLEGEQVKVRIPTGAHDGHIKSGVLRGLYSQSMSVDLFFMSQWEDGYWNLTQHRSFRLLKTPLVPQTPVFSSDTVPVTGLFSATLGFFAPDVSLQKVTVDGGGDLLTWTPSHQTQNDTDLKVSRLLQINGSSSYQLHLSLSHPNIIPKYVGGGNKTYSLTFTFTFNISPSGEVFYHQASVEHSAEYTALGSLILEGKCKQSSLLVLLYYGAQTDLQWELFLGARKLDWELVEMGGFVVKAEDEYLTVEIPFHSPGLKYEELTLCGFVAVVEVSVVEAASLKVQDSLVHKCTFPPRELLVCLPEGRVVAVVDTTHTIPPTNPNRTSLSDPSCVPVETDSARALFNFSLSSCGTTVTTKGNFLVYENQIHYNQGFLPLDEPVIHRDSPYSLTIQCRYPLNETRILSVQHPGSSHLDTSPCGLTSSCVVTCKL
ncbi:uncharacterized protein LOC117152772 [Mastacembelus armatus]|uniref:uncharacterized protein LOC117152772 n=1 Tax=Mastacembelus armatus TaxID=205130 RepID=UPI001436CB1F|nr:uncharacterized protein LOC117152772 [Mastacembelus armatus]